MSEKIVLTKMELLKMARELVINEYIDKRAQDHNKWLADAEVTWKTQGVNLPYPSFPVYPTEVDILSRATTLNTFLSQDSQAQKSIVDSVDLTVSEQKQESPSAVPVATTIIPPPVVEIASVATVDLDILPDSTVTEIMSEVVEPEVVVPVEPAARLALPEYVPDTATLSVIEQLRAKLGLK